ncbi:MAG TPA: hypothetical protein VMF89_27260, partial [Polyangiales bacterium]|nr:hypothetical protein [Polyangiales bacterium]
MIRNTIVAAAALLLSAAPALAHSKRTCDRVEVNGMQMYYEVSGKGEPIVVLHGAHMNIQTMGDIIPRLAK